MKIVLGLGNPGGFYAHTYHNMGFLAVECLAEKLGAEFSKKECDALTAHASIPGAGRVILAKPQTFMNLSGTAAQKLLHYYKCGVADLIVLYDDIDLEKGAIRYRETGSAGTHNGMRDIVLKVGESPRVRIGIGRPEAGRDLASYVLGNVPEAERPLLAQAIEEAAQKVLSLCGHGDSVTDHKRGL
jgi:PTH1 family peptidyl-tRNA hydrolase